MPHWQSAPRDIDTVHVGNLTLSTSHNSSAGAWEWTLHLAGRGMTAGASATEGEAKRAALEAAFRLSLSGHERLAVAKLLAATTPPLDLTLRPMPGRP